MKRTVQKEIRKIGEMSWLGFWDEVDWRNRAVLVVVVVVVVVLPFSFISLFLFFVLV